MRKTLSLLFMTLSLSAGLMAQKFGYVNTALLLQDLPEVQAANSELEAYQKQLMADGQEKVRAFESHYQDYMTKVNNGDLSKVQMAAEEEKLTAEQQSIAALEQDVQNKIMTKREEVLTPILEKVDVAIQEVGKEGGYTFIFDSSVQGALLHAPDSDDLIEEVKAKLLQ